MRKLDLVIVGAQKAGTTSLNQYLKSHSGVVGHSVVEFTYFTDHRLYNTGFESAFKKYFDKQEYKKIVAKNVTISQNEDSLIKLREHNQDVKIVFLLREPVSRAYSSFNMAIKDGWIDTDFNELQKIIIDKNYNHIKYRHFIKPGQYASSLKMILKYFPENNIRIYLFEDLMKFPQLISNDIFEWINLDKSIISTGIHNITVKPRSRYISRLVNLMRSQNNFVNRTIRKILPYNYYNKFGQMIINLNRSKSRFDPMNSNMKGILENHYSSSNRELISLLNKDKLKDSFIMFSTNNWISEIHN